MAKFIVCEFIGQSDFRPLGIRGEFLTGSFSQLEVAEFATEHAAAAAARLATNRIPGSEISIIGRAKQAVA
jgi:hypothetical protein